MRKQIYKITKYQRTISAGPHRMNSGEIHTLNSFILQNASSNRAKCSGRNFGPDMLSYILRYLLVSPPNAVPQLMKFLPSDRYVISLNSDTVNIGRHSLPLLLRFLSPFRSRLRRKYQRSCLPRMNLCYISEVFPIFFINFEKLWENKSQGSSIGIV